MFQPNSIKGLLRKKQEREISKSVQEGLNTESQKTIYDPDLQYLVDTKCTIKEIDMTIQNIRQWRKDQKASLERNLRVNEEIATILQSRLKSHQQDAEDSDQLINKFREKAASQKKAIEGSELLKQQQQSLKNNDRRREASDSIKQIVADRLKQTEEKRGQILEPREETMAIKDQHMAFIESMDELEDMLKKAKPVEKIASTEENSTVQNSSVVAKPTVKKEKVKNELDEIDRELRELQELFKSVD